MALSPFVFDFPFGMGRASRDPLDFGALLPSLSTVAPSVSAHPMDIIDTPSSFKITVDTPGMDAGDISITLEDGVMTIAGKQKSEAQEKDKEGRVLRRERAFTSFSRSFTIPDNVEDDKISAHLHNGVLEVIVPKVAPPPKAEPRRINITSSPVATQEGTEVPKVTKTAAAAATCR